MNVLVFASRKGGAGKSTLAAHLATYIAEHSRSTLLIDGDPQGSLSLWHRLRGEEQPALKTGIRGLAQTLEKAERDGVEWVLIDTPPDASPPVAEAIRHATLVVIPMRPGLFDLAAVRETIQIARELGKPYAVVLNAAPAKRGRDDAAVVADARGALNELKAPVWSGQITHRPEMTLSLSYGEGVKEYGSRSVGAEEIRQLWLALTRTVDAVQAAYRRQTGRRVNA
jgi:chromosome partitioning protein